MFCSYCKETFKKIVRVHYNTDSELPYSGCLCLYVLLSRKELIVVNNDHNTN